MVTRDQRRKITQANGERKDDIEEQGRKTERRKWNEHETTEN